MWGLPREWHVVDWCDTNLHYLSTLHTVACISHVWCISYILFYDFGLLLHKSPILYLIPNFRALFVVHARLHISCMVYQLILLFQSKLPTKLHCLSTLYTIARSLSCYFNPNCPLMCLSRPLYDASVAISYNQRHTIHWHISTRFSQIHPNYSLICLFLTKSSVLQGNISI